MMTSQCVPGWDSDHIINTNSDVPSMEDEEVAELTWENGHLAMHGLRPPRLSTKPPPPANYAAAWDKPRPRPGPGTLESLVNQATTCFQPPPAVNDVQPWFDHRRAAAAVVDAIVPCNNHRQDSSKMFGSKTNASASESTATCGDRHQVAPGGGGLTSTSLWSEEYTKTTSGDSISHSRSQREEGGDDEVEKKKKKKKKKKLTKSSVSTKRSRAAAIHNQSERKRRDKINQKMQTLQKLIPNSSKTDKASILDEVIEYLKQLQAQVHTMNRINIPQMMLQHHFQMSMMAATAAAHQPHHMPVMDFNSLNRAAAMPPPFMPMPGSWDMQGDRPVMPHDFMSAFLAGQSAQSQPHQPMTMDAYSRLAALYQQFRQQGPGSGPVSSSKN